MKNNKIVTTWIPAEIQYASKGETPNPEINANKAMIARLKDSNYRLAEAVLAESFIQDKDFFQFIRTKIARGNLDEAEQIIDEYLKSTDNFAETLLPDTLLELCRVYYHKARWQDSIKVINLALSKQDVSAITRITLLQMRTVSLFEIGEFEKCLMDIEEIRSLSILFPFSQCCLYAEALHIKVIARTDGIQRAELFFKKCVKKYLNVNEDGMPDRLLTLLRIKIDLLRLQNKPYASIALACQLLADSMGDDLYKALAILDLAFSENENLSKGAKTQLLALRNKFEKVQIILNEIESLNPESTSSKAISFYQPPKSENMFNEEINEILILDLNLKINLKNLNVSTTTLKNQSLNILKIISENIILRETIFSNVWKLDYDVETHDATLRNAIVRLRKQANIKIICSDQKIIIPNTLLISTEDFSLLN